MYLSKPTVRLTVFLAALMFIASWICVPVCNGQTDDKGYQRIISLAPNLTEIIFELGLGDQIIAVSNFDTYPEEVEKLPRIGGYFNPNLELMISMRPDVIFGLSGKSTKMDKLKKTGAVIHQFKCDKVSEVYDTIQSIGKILSVETSADSLCKQLQNGLNQLHLPGIKGLSVMVCVGMTPGSLQNIYVSGNASIHHDLLTAIGCKNSFEDVKKSYFPVNKESLIIARPDVILDLIPGQSTDQESIKIRMDTWKLIPGIPASRIIIMSQEELNIPGPRLPLAGQLIRQEIAKALTREIPDE